MEYSGPCNLSVLADETTFYCPLSAYEGVVNGVTNMHLWTRLKVVQAHSIEP